MRRVANSIILSDKIEEDFILDEMAQPTEDSYQFKRYAILDVNDNIIEEGRTLNLNANTEDIRKSLGIEFGTSTWITN